MKLRDQKELDQAFARAMGSEPGLREEIAASLDKAAKAHTAHQQKYGAAMDALPDGTVIRSGQNLFEKQTVGGDVFWHHMTKRGKDKGFLTSRQTLKKAGSNAIDAFIG